MILTYESKKYVFNVPESFQRFITQNGAKFSKESHIYFTRLSTDNTSGVFGLMLTLFENKLCFNTKFYGPPGLSNFLGSLKSMMGFKILPYSGYDFVTREKLLGIKKKESLDKLMLEKKLFGLNLMQEFKDKVKEEINDPEEYVHESSFYKDEKLSIIPIVLSKSKARNFELNEVRAKFTV